MSRRLGCGLGWMVRGIDMGLREEGRCFVCHIVCKPPGFNFQLLDSLVKKETPCSFIIKLKNQLGVE